MSLVKIVVPANLDFADLRLARNPHNGGVQFNWGAIEHLCAANNIDVDLFKNTSEDNVSGLIVAWYFEHRARGGAPDQTAEDLILEAVAEDKSGGGISHKPGSA